MVGLFEIKQQFWLIIIRKQIRINGAQLVPLECQDKGRVVCLQTCVTLRLGVTPDYGNVVVWVGHGVALIPVYFVY